MSFFKKINNLDTKRNFVSLEKNRLLKLGQDIDGQAFEDYFGWSVSMNAVGNRIAIGARYSDGQDGYNSGRGHVSIYNWDGANWTQLGQNINGEDVDNLFGHSVSMNAVGDRVAIAAIYNDVGGARIDAGHVRVYSWNGTSWTQLGADIDGEATSDESGFSISMNAIGDRVAIGARWNDGSVANSDRGHVRVYSWNGTSWTKLGADIDGEATADTSGWSISMNAVGDRVAIGAPSNDVGGVRVDAGHVRVYSWNGTSWTQLGGDIDGETTDDQSGYSVSMNAIGDRVAIGAIYNDGAVLDSDRGHVRVYSWNGTSWTQLGADIDGEAGNPSNQYIYSGDDFGWYVSMNAIGDRVAIGAPYNDGAGISSGHVRVYSWNGTSWTQLGIDIDGEAAGDESGWSVSMNAIGDKIAIGAIKNNVNGVSDVGHVRVYYDYVSYDNWKQLGTNINGEGAYDYSGYSVSMNYIGNRVAIGARYNDGSVADSDRGHVRVYSWNGTSWTQLGADIDGEAAYDESHSVSMNAVGDRVAIGALYNDVGGARIDAGHVRVYSWNGTSWVKLGADIDGEATNDQSGFSISMNAIGDRVAIGAVYNDGSVANSDRGHVRVYSWNGTSWTKLGADIDGEADSDLSGYSVSMNAIGDRVAIGAIYNDGSVADSGHVRVYSWNGTSWTQLGADIDGEATNDLSGFSVSMNAIGDRVAIGAIYNDGGGISSGHVRIYSWNGTSWTQLGADIDGEATNDQSGYSVSMNAIGDRVAIGSRLNDENGNSSGHVRVYSWNGTSWTQLGIDIDGEAAFDSLGHSVSINAAGNRIAIGAMGAGVSNSGQVKVFEISL